MAALVGAGGPAAYGGDNRPRTTAVITQYTGCSSVSANDPPNFAYVGTNDGIANVQTMQNRIDKLRVQGTDAEMEVFAGRSQGFGWGTETRAAGRMDRAGSCWEKHIKWVQRFSTIAE